MWNGSNEDTKKAIRIKMLRKEIHGIAHKVVQPGTRRHQEEGKAGKK
jgi:hypothetical protein